MADQQLTDSQKNLVLSAMGDPVLASAIVTAADNAFRSSGNNWRTPVSIIDTTSTTVPAPFATNSLVLDGRTIILNDRVLFTNLTDPSLNNDVFEVVKDNNTTLKFKAANEQGDKKAEDGDVIYVENGTLGSRTMWSVDGGAWGQIVSSDPSALSLHIDGSNSPTATIDFGAQDLINVDAVESVTAKLGPYKVYSPFTVIVPAGPTVLLDLSVASNFIIERDLASGPTQVTILSGNVKDGGEYTIAFHNTGAGLAPVTWVGGVQWPGGTAPTLSDGPSRDYITLKCSTAGGNYFAGSFELNYPA